MKKIYSLVLVLLAVVSVARASDVSDVRNTVQSVFEQLKSRDFAGVYDALPGSTRNRMSRDRFVGALQRSQDWRLRDSRSGFAV